MKVGRKPEYPEKAPPHPHPPKKKKKKKKKTSFRRKKFIAGNCSVCMALCSTQNLPPPITPPPPPNRPSPRIPPLPIPHPDPLLRICKSMVRPTFYSNLRHCFWSSDVASTLTLAERTLEVAGYFRLLGLLAKASASRVVDPGFHSRFLREDIFKSCHASDLNIGTPVATPPGVMGSALRLVGPVSVYCGRVR